MKNEHLIFILYYICCILLKISAWDFEFQEAETDLVVYVFNLEI